MAGEGKLERIERLTNECIDMCRTMLHGRKHLEALLEPSFRTHKLQRAVSEQKVAVKEMEAAVDRILTAVEGMSEIDFSDAASAGEKVAAGCDEIMEACCFQDMVGQRMSQVNETLAEIESTLAKLAEGQEAQPAPPLQEDEGLLNGPALPGAAMEQGAVDRLLAGGKGKR
ncbi:protein phosphatase CheZ [Parvibaculum sp.]|jgi:chemotaxis protein CheZ|uniref:protein phosphatase CheZ n=1 Tax=Parvibaculum sp. TaxID=2024848 RepID=UPI000C655BD3|nr:protein phosphatase CheZ [Parvibaculum sp.]MAM95198.1 hypothetical protein [Parvibaculum sp.]|tara:strand:+ start:10058 stop:10570 length:513 start_codon:yes stop_codon:yes gene_type:complete